MLEILQIPVLTDNYIYLLHEPSTGQTAVVDPAVAEPVLDALEQNGWRLDYIFNTHHHGDHVGGNLQLKQSTGCKVVGAAFDNRRIPGIDITVADGETVQLGLQSFQIISTPGHTLGHIVYYCPDSLALFCGDTLFSLGCGRLFEGSAEQMWHSLQKLKALPGDTRIYCAHEYTQANGRFAMTLDADNPDLLQRLAEVAELRHQNLPTVPSTLSVELATNPFLREHSADLRKAISARDDTPAHVFAKVRLLKDHFR
ncbi:hydroxyacylglutathione hydrolase [Methylomonas sp. LL1]|uniref:hydroxyacylglutathione hydrolase n=1 Tax=Methylomonas sp. LL1 TaxID=2785785 RepID=UPI0018C4273B|nr:hydroxyacylglutathione hydrolase [Methylomonas sp. LL1]QPK63450.1 hydroxyacylglutathione hydrolase [Methylomonas sp. LL1]CAG1020402.1 hydroxyacylglutathione hydrolase [Methylococcales bacterium]